MLKNELTAIDILNYIPHKPPFLFIDEIISFNSEQISGSYTFKKDETFYAGHYPNKPITPGVILLESMCQLGLAAFAIYLCSLDANPIKSKDLLFLMTDANFEVLKPVYPGEKVIITSNKLIWRRLRLRCKVEMHDSKGNLVATTVASGLGVISK